MIHSVCISDSNDHNQVHSNIRLSGLILKVWRYRRLPICRPFYSDVKELFEILSIERFQLAECGISDNRQILTEVVVIRSFFLVLVPKTAATKTLTNQAWREI
jgi:hypothetical protein